MTTLSIRVSDAQQVSAILTRPLDPIACYVMAHGAGAGMTHPFMAVMTHGFAERGVATLRYQFPFMENGSKRPDLPALAHATVGAAVAEAARQLPRVPLIAGGKSFGGRMTSQAQAKMPLPKVVGLAFAGFPLHPAGKPSVERARHLSEVLVPMLFLQGTRDALAELTLLRGVIAELGSTATLRTIQHADHTFHVPARSGQTDAQAREAMLDAFVAWFEHIIHPANDAG